MTAGCTRMLVLGTLGLWAIGCGPARREVRPDRDARSQAPVVHRSAVTEPAARDPVHVPAEPARDPQQMLDEALEFCQASQEFWSRGDLDGAVAALDRATALLLEAECGEDPALSQQKDDIRFMIAKRLLEIHASRHTVAAGKYKAIPRTVNAEVEAEIKLFQGAQRKFFLNSYRRSGRYRKKILAALREAGLPEELSWLPLIESGFKIKALSSARALGLWQFIPSTGYRFGLERDEWIDERMDPDKSTRAAIAYLREMHKIFGDWCTVLAAYNCGENRVLRVIRGQNVNYLDNFWDLYQKLPKETRRYVPRFLAALAILENPDKYGFSFETPDAPPARQEVEIDQQVELKQVAAGLGVSVEALERLNPELRRGITPPAAYTLRVPVGKAEALAGMLDKIPRYTPPRRRFIYHRIRQGETLSHLAHRYRTTVAAIARVNRMGTSDLLRLDQMLKIPVKGKMAPGGNQRRRRHAATAATGSYRVQAGDSLWAVARRFGTDVHTIKELNGLSGPELRVGQKLRVPTRAMPAARNAGTRVYQVRPGDSPYTIARRHHMELERFLRINQLTSHSRIFPGQQVLVDDD